MLVNGSERWWQCEGDGAVGIVAGVLWNDILILVGVLVTQLLFKKFDTNVHEDLFMRASRMRNVVDADKNK